MNKYRIGHSYTTKMLLTVEFKDTKGEREALLGENKNDLTKLPVTILFSEV